MLKFLALFLKLLTAYFCALGITSPLAPTNRPGFRDQYKFEGTLTAVTAKDITLRAPNGSLHKFLLHKALVDGTYLKDPNGGYDHRHAESDPRFSYRIGDIRVYDKLVIHCGVYNNRLVCEQICIHRRFTGRIPPMPSMRRSYMRYEYHNVATDMSWFELIGRLPPDNYEPPELPEDERDPVERRPVRP